MKITIRSLMLFCLTGMLTTMCTKKDFSGGKDEVKSSPPSTLTRYRDIVFAEDTVERNIIYRHDSDYAFGDAVKWNLALDFFEPKNDTAQKRPLIVLMHGGGHITGFRDWMEPVAKRLVQYGFVVANISYRLDPTMYADFLPPAKDSPSQTINRNYSAMYRATQDARYAIRYCKSRALAGKIDTNYVYVMGGSAGGINAVFVGYMDMYEVTYFTIDELARFGELDFSDGTDEFGSVNAKVKAVIGIPGASFDLSWIKTGDPAAVMFHSAGDSYFGPECGLDGPWALFNVCGGKSITQRCAQLGIPNFYKEYPDPLYTNFDLIPTPEDSLTHGSVFNSTANINEGVDSIAKFLYRNNLSPH